MSLEGTVLALVLIAATAGFIALPLLRRESRTAADTLAQERRREALTGLYERVLTNLRDLEEDFNTGKIAQTQYEVERAEWVERGGQVLRALDQMNAETPPPEAADEALDREIEAAIAAYRSKEA